MGLINLDISARTNRAPNISGWLSLSLAYNQLYTFTVADFTTNTIPPYADPEGDAFAGVKITALPTQGTLTLSAVPVIANDVISEANITAGNLKYQCDPADTDGYSDGTMRFSVSDVGSGLYYPTPQICTFVVASNLNQPPTTVGDGSLDITLGQVVVFTRAMLTSQLIPPYSDPEGNPADKLWIISLPSHGTLKLNGVNVVVDQKINFTDIDAGLFVYTNTSLTQGGIEGFQFKISDTGSGEYRG